MAKTDLFIGSGVITPGANGNSFAVTDLSAPKTVRVQGLSGSTTVPLMVQNRASDGWEYWGEELSAKNKSITPVEIGVFAVSGEVDGAVIIYTEDAS